MSVVCRANSHNFKFVFGRSCVHQAHSIYVFVSFFCVRYATFSLFTLQLYLYVLYVNVLCNVVACGVLPILLNASLANVPPQRSCVSLAHSPHDFGQQVFIFLC